MTPHLAGQCIDGQSMSQPQGRRANRSVEAEGQQELASRLPEEPAARLGCVRIRST